MPPETLHDSIVNFLNSSKSKERVARCLCGAVLEPRYTTFFYDGQSWEIVLQVCVKCNPAPKVPVWPDA
jgi:hypothetical protein